MATQEAKSMFVTGNTSEGRTRWASKGKRFFITYPHCIIGKDRAAQILVERFDDNIKELIVAEEVHRDGDKHLHVLVLFKRNITLTIDGAKLEDNVGHIETVRCPMQAKRYTMKEGNYIVYPENANIRRPKATTQDLLHGNIADLVENEKISIYSVDRLMKARRTLEQIRPPTKTKPYVMWFYGTTGMGKTRAAVSYAEERKQSYWISNGTLQWFDGYLGQEVAILDEVRGNACDWSFFLRLLDRYRIMVPVKGGFMNWVPNTIIITSSGRPEEVFINHGTGQVWDSIAQLLRRIDEVWEFYAENEKRCVMEHGEENVTMQMVPPAVDLDEENVQPPEGIEPESTELFYVAPPLPGPNDVPHLDPEQEPMDSFVQKGN